jgi:hypothetical protein
LLFQEILVQAKRVLAQEVFNHWELERHDPGRKERLERSLKSLLRPTAWYPLR